MATSNSFTGYRRCAGGGYARTPAGAAKICGCEQQFRQARTCDQACEDAGTFVAVWMTGDDAVRFFGMAFILNGAPELGCLQFCETDPVHTSAGGPVFTPPDTTSFPSCVGCAAACFRQARDCTDDSLVDIWMTCDDALIASGGTLGKSFTMISGPEGCYYFAGGDGTFTVPGGTLYVFSDALATGVECGDCVPCAPCGEFPSGCLGPFSNGDPTEDFYTSDCSVCDLTWEVCGDCDLTPEITTSGAYLGLPVALSGPGSVSFKRQPPVGEDPRIEVDVGNTNTFDSTTFGWSINVFDEPGGVFLGRISSLNNSPPDIDWMTLAKTATGATGAIICGLMEVDTGGVESFCLVTATITIRQRCCNDPPP